MRKILILACLTFVFFFSPKAIGADKEPPTHHIEFQVEAWFNDFTGLYERLGDHDLDGDRYLNDNAPVFLEVDDSDLAPFIRILYMRNGDYGFSLSYTQLKGDGSLSALDTSVRGFFINNIDRLYWWDSYVSWIGGEIETELTFWDINFVYGLRYKNADTYWRALAGISFEKYDEENVHSYDDLNNDPPEIWYTVHSMSEFCGWGPSIGTEFSHRIRKVQGLAFLAGAKMSYLQGESKTRRIEIDDPRDVFSRYTAFDISSETDESVWKAEANIGVKYTFDFGLGLQLTYRYSRWENLPNTPLSVDDSAYHIVDRTRDVSAHGITAGLFYQWNP